MANLGNPNPSPATRWTKETAPRDTERARKGNIASNKVKAEKKRTAEVIATFFQMKPSELGFDISDIPPEMRDTISVQDLMVFRQLQKAVDNGDADLGSFNAIMDRCEGKPIQTVVADVQTTSSEDVSLDEALALAQQIKSEKPAKPKTARKTSKPKKVEE